MNEALARLEIAGDFMETAVDLFGDAVFLVGPDRRILYWNRAAEQLTGYRREDAVGKPCLAAVHCVVCEERCGVFELGDLHDVPLTIRRRDGRSVEVIKTATVLRTPSGEAVLGLEVLRDMTDWNAREAASREARRAAESQKVLLRGILDSVTEGIVGLGPEGRVLFVSISAQATLGLAEDQAVGQSIESVAGGEVARLVDHVLRSGGAVHRTRLSLPVPGGGIVPASVGVAPMSLPEETRRGAMVLLSDLREEERALRERLRAQDFAYGTLVSRSPRMREVFDLIDQVAKSSATILIQGASGTGKELVAREIHRRSRRSAGPFHAVNCAAISHEILESEFFGHERGAFTGAVLRKKGRFEVAHTGTIFLDEVGELPLELQAKLLRVLEEREFERVGGTETLQVDVRVVAATNRDLLSMVHEGRFREDLYYRLRVVPLRLPALRERIEDVEMLAEHSLRRIAEREEKEPLRLAPDAIRRLMDHEWPGNVRELLNAMEYAAVVARGPLVQEGDLPRELREPEEVLRTRGAQAAPVEPASVGEGDDRERARIESALQESRWSHGRAAKLLGIHRTTLYRKRLRYGL